MLHIYLKINAVIFSGVYHRMRVYIWGKAIFKAHTNMFTGL